MKTACSPASSAKRPESLWPNAVAIEHLERKAWLHDCIKDMVGLGYGIAGKTRSNTLLVRK